MPKTFKKHIKMLYCQVAILVSFVWCFEEKNFDIKWWQEKEKD